MIRCININSHNYWRAFTFIAFVPKSDEWRSLGFRVTVVARYDLIHQWVVKAMM